MKHEFGIMENAPLKDFRYDDYEPHKYNCISVDDELVELIAPKLADVKMYHHSLEVCAKGLAYTGVTLIEPETFPIVIEVVSGYNELKELKNLFDNALKENKFVVHYGL